MAIDPSARPHHAASIDDGARPLAAETDSPHVRRNTDLLLADCDRAFLIPT